MQHMIQKPNPRPDPNVLRRSDLGRMVFGVLRRRRRDPAAVAGAVATIAVAFAFAARVNVVIVVGAGKFGRGGEEIEGAAIEGEGELDFGFVGVAGEVGGAAGKWV